jgi:RNA polymerase sigma factor (sigma-70 family)
MTMEAALSTVTADEEAMQRVAQGDSAALALLFDRHRRRLYGFLCHMVGDAALAEDLLSETFLRVYRARGRYRQGADFVPWMLAIARNLAIGELRRQTLLSRIRLRLLREPVEEVGPAPERDETRDKVRQALQRLPEDQRAAVVLKEYEGLSYREIADVLGCTEEAARARTYRARVALKEALREWWEAG